MKRIIDILLSFIVLVLGMPFYLIIGMLIALDTKGRVLYKQSRVGRNNVDFELYKFRTMCVDADQGSLITVGTHDARITRVGAFLRRFKIDEVPQFFNILKGEMSIVGPRPEVRKYVDMYTPEQMRVLSVRPGLTDYASIRYVNENEILAASSDPERTYIEDIMPDKLNLNLKYIDEQSFWTDVKIILQTIIAIINRKTVSLRRNHLPA
ncbi:MAG: sugar transferase [Bacteroidales bacterium]|jgi:lipopolysaccharide/colanic/teichoic acid biosynthesis glycosyltransferase|nr:sugar transferase [Bacteroidales bacterium]MBR3466635.1 sugar transferase [Bacteroidales bacterium]MBR4637675.1 sugar transferase [Bacteroidales bacterium]MBR5920979.1 sugar transferase [Bacteroidales bacterium]MBR6903717.1 sugar transferase [Bacteroidales bacterium]